MTSTSLHSFTAKTQAGLEQVLADELTALGAREVTVQKRAVAFEGDQEIMVRANLWSRTAISILKEITQFDFDGKEAFYEQIKQIPWHSYFSVDNAIAVHAIANRSPLFTNTLFLAQLTKDAIADRFRDECGRRPDVDTASAGARIHVYVQENHCIVSLDSSGDPLFKRGYRRATGVAPLNEVLAAGLILLSGWDKRSIFMDPMCGSATFSIEAALMATNTAPGLYRKSFGFSHWNDYNPELFNRMKEEANAQQRPLETRILASDVSGKDLDTARQNILVAGFTGRIQVQRNDFFFYEPPRDQGWVLLNPPYDMRLTKKDLPEFYKQIGNTLKRNYAGYKAGIITEGEAGLKYTGLKPSSKTVVYNGPIECRFAQYDLFEGFRKEHVMKQRAKRPRL